MYFKIVYVVSVSLSGFELIMQVADKQKTDIRFPLNIFDFTN